MTATMKNIALAPLDDSRGAGRWATSDPWCLVPKLHRKSMTSNLFLELTVHFQTGRRSFAEWEHAGEPPGRTISRQFEQTQTAGSACPRHDGTRTPRSAHLPQRESAPDTSPSANRSAAVSPMGGEDQGPQPGPEGAGRGCGTRPGPRRRRLTAAAAGRRRAARGTRPGATRTNDFPVPWTSLNSRHERARRHGLI